MAMTSQDGAAVGQSAPGDAATCRAGAAPARRAGGSWTRRTAVAGAVVLAAAGLGAWFVAGGPARQGITPVAGPPDCPASLPSQSGLPSPSSLPARRDGLDLRIVPVLPLPVGPIGATLCHYPAGSLGSGPSGGPTGPVRGALLDAVRTAEVAGWLDSGRSEAPANLAATCPTDDGSVVVITFRYAEGPPVQVTVHRSGCRLVSNGVRTELPRPDVVALIDRMVPPRDRP